MRELPPGEKVDGILGFGLFAGCLLTLDYPAQRRAHGPRASCPRPTGATCSPSPASAASRRRASRWRGARWTRTWTPASWAGSRCRRRRPAALPLPAPPKVVGRGQTLGNTFEIKAAPLDGDVAIGAIVLERPMVEFQPVFPMANVGARILRDLVVTFDQKNNRMRVAKPAR